MAPLNSLNSALIAALGDSTGLQALIGSNLFQGRVPSTSADKYPRVTVGEASDRDALGTEGATFNKTTRAIGENIHIWSQKGRHEMLEIYGEIYDALHRVRLTLTTGQMIAGASVQLVTDLLDPDGKTTHGIARFSAFVV
jgi:hypothetical protein